MHALGDFTIHRVIEMEQPFTTADTFLPNSDPEVIAANADWLKPDFIDPQTDELIFSFQSYVVKTPRHTILVDSCIGNDKPRPARPVWDMMKSSYLADLAASGVPPEQIDFVMCTHLHVDHVGWNTKLVDGRWVPTFPNAEYIFAKREYDFWERRHREGGQGPVPNVFDDSVLPVMEAGQAKLVDMDYQFDNGLWFEPAPGHTEGNVVINLTSGGARAVLAGDVIHHPIQLVRPDWSSRACEDKAQSATTRKALLERVADTDILFAPAHFASPSMGHVVGRGDGFGYRLLNGG